MSAVFQALQEPRILPCLHSFCGQCLHKQIERSGTKQNMECPTCQRSITIPEGGINSIPQNLHLGFEVEVAGYMSKIGSDDEMSCDACIDESTRPAVVFCCTCHVKILVLLDQAGTWLLTIKGNVSGPQNFENPYGLALDSQGNIYVAARGSSTIKVFSSEGTYNQRYILPLDRWTVEYVKISMTVLNILKYDKYISVDRTDSNCSYDGESIKKGTSGAGWRSLKIVVADHNDDQGENDETTPNDVRNSEQLHSITPVDEFDISVNPGSRGNSVTSTTAGKLLG
eukprot:Em0004g1467a